MLHRGSLGFWILSLAVLISSPGGTRAADLVEVPRYDWSGFYIGAHVGYGDPNFLGVFDSSNLPAEPAAAAFANDINADGFIGGIHAGYNIQTGALVLGIEADASFTDFTGDASDDGSDGGFDVIKVDADFLASLRGRAGFAIDRVLLFGTAGAAYEVVDVTETDDRGDPNENSGDVTLDSLGFVGGGGIEWAVTDHISLRAEGLYYLFDDKKDTSHLTKDSDQNDFIELKDVVVVRGGVTFHF